MGTLTNLCDYKKDEWREVFATDGTNSTLQVFANTKTGEAEIVQMDDEGDAIRTTLTTRDFWHLVEVLNKHCITSNEKV